MLTEQNKKDILFLYCEGYSRTELHEMFAGIDPVEIDNICDEEDRSWDLK